METKSSFTFKVPERMVKALKSFKVEPLKEQMITVDTENNILSVEQIEITGFYPAHLQGQKQIPEAYTNRFIFSYE